ncbi:hypothetical protein CVO76_16120 [Arthrobacter agilis]|uniref:Uncharacterized protein n=2 Tax=Arthrobacter agilis TaxID=37921 RepID=A0A2L0UID8_9MICC|nr:hypothetical protein CVO76_16120 [Arthrobacter agilis]
MAYALAVKMPHGRCEVNILGDDRPVQALAHLLGTGAQGACYGTPIGGTIVELAIPYPDIEPFVVKYGHQ